ncbi:MAG: C13 family peptidase [Sphingomicrobium sp.]
MRHVIGLALVVLGACALGSAAAPAQVSTPDDQARFEHALDSLKPQRPGTIDAYVIVAALDTDPVFEREARETARVLSSRFDAAGRTLVLAESEGDDEADAAATPERLAEALARTGRLIDPREDVVVLYTTSHGSPQAGLNFRDAARGSAIITPDQLGGMFDRPGIKNRLVILQACFAGQFIPALQSPSTVVATAASAMKSSFGCTAGNDWTFFGYALIDLAMRKPDTFVRQFRRAFVTILEWEKELGVEPSNPQLSVGSDTGRWMAALDSHASMVPATPVGHAPSELVH